MRSENEEISKQINKLENIRIDISKRAEEKVSAINQLLCHPPPAPTPPSQEMRTLMKQRYLG